MHTKSKLQVLEELKIDKDRGVPTVEIAARRTRYGANSFAAAKRKPLILRVLGAFSEPMLLILCFALAVTVGVETGKFLRTGEGDFVECIGIFCALIISVTVTVVMEGRSERAFELLGSLSDNAVVKVRRDGEIRLIPRSEVVVGDILILESGCKIVADGRVIKSDGLCADESTLTGESRPRGKRADARVGKDAPLAERINIVYGGTLVASGSGEAVVFAVGENAEIGKIAGELRAKNRISAPLNEKLNRLGKAVTLIGGISAALVFIVSVVRLALAGAADFDSIREVFTESVVLIVAAVPEGLPTIVAVSLSLNVMKLSKENALIKKLVVAETSGCVSVICSDKTGTLTENKMRVEEVVSENMKVAGAVTANVNSAVHICRNIIINSTATSAVTEKAAGKKVLVGDPTECALIEWALSDPLSISSERGKYSVISREQFSSEKKYMSTKTRINGVEVEYFKGSPEKICELIGAGRERTARIKESVARYSSKAMRVIAFARKEGGAFYYDGFAAISDPVRKDVKESVAMCREAGIDVKILTGDNAETAFAVARELGIAVRADEVLNGPEVERMTDEVLSKRLSSISVIARSTPLIKLRVVKLLKAKGEVVAVTGDGVNDAPAIKQADIGIAMGSGSEIAKEAGDIVLLDDSFATIVKAIEFGRNVFENFRRFIMFQLSVNFSAVIIVLASLFMGLKSPFTALQLLWINIIMDGPPALTLGFEPADAGLMRMKPKKRSSNLVTARVGARVLIHSVYMAALVILQILFNFLGAPLGTEGSAVFTLFVTLQLFNAFNCKQVGSASVLRGFFGNVPMLVAFGAVFVGQIIITQFGGTVFGTAPLPITVWVKIIAVAASVMLISEAYKLVYRLAFGARGINRGRLYARRALNER